MQNRLGHTATGNALGESYSADQVVGNRLKTKRPVTAYLGSPGSSRTETWQAGFTSPPVYSWVQQGGDLYWMIGELQPIRYVKHDPDAIEVVPYSGGSQYLKNTDQAGFSLPDLQNLGQNVNQAVKTALPWAIGLGALYLTFPLIKAGFSRIAKEIE